MMEISQRRSTDWMTPFLQIASETLSEALRIPQSQAGQILEERMALSHFQHFMGECPNAHGIDDRYVTEEMAVTCLPYLRRLAAGSSLSGHADSLDEYENPYLAGYCDVIEACFAQILDHLEDYSHKVDCNCDRCRLVHRVLVSSLRRFQTESGSEVWIRMHRN